MSSEMMRVLVVDDHRTVADALSLAVSAQPDMESVGTAGGVVDALAIIDRARPDAIVMDVHLDDGDGIELTRRVTDAHPQVRVVVLTAHVTHALLARASEAGASALLPKGGPLAELIQAVREASRGTFAVHPVLLRALVGNGSGRQGTPELLTSREQQVLALLAQGRDPTAIARTLGISVLTCRGYIKNILVKLDAHSQLEAVMIALRRKLIRLDDEI
ncbi:response regulator [Terrabacter sp. 2TAF16]|uniref:response regulator transcription factor n=1 Tax=Terrabacter sp. 2TAF16 TaxID=3233008 RepID=UPI003F9D8EAF